LRAARGGPVSQFRAHGVQGILRSGGVISARAKPAAMATLTNALRRHVLHHSYLDVVVGIVFGAFCAFVISILTKDMLKPMIGAIVGNSQFAGLSFTIHGSSFAYGELINAAIAILSLAAVAYLFMVRPQHAAARRAAVRPAPALRLHVTSGAGAVASDAAPARLASVGQAKAA
jgi:large-conductance mechanosensitive channel